MEPRPTGMTPLPPSPSSPVGFRLLAAAASNIPSLASASTPPPDAPAPSPLLLAVIVSSAAVDAPTILAVRTRFSMSMIPGQVTVQWSSKNRGTRNWEPVMQPAVQQTQGFLPRRWYGACVPAAYGDAVTARLTIANPGYDFHVDRDYLIHLAASNGVLSQEGSSPYWIGRLGFRCGIPLVGKHFPGADKLLGSTPGRACAMGLDVQGFLGVPIPGTPYQELKFYADCLKFREHLCDCLDEGPIVAGLYLQKHWSTPRADDVPYIPLRGEEHYAVRRLDNGVEVPMGHCVTIYGYECAGGDVGSLVLLCQDNMVGAPGRQRMSPDAVDAYFVPVMHGVKIVEHHLPGNELTEELRAAKAASTSPGWYKIMNRARDLFSSPAFSDKVPSMAISCDSLASNHIGNFMDLEFKLYYYGAQGHPTAKDYVRPLSKIQNHIYWVSTLSSEITSLTICDASLATKYMETSEMADLERENLGLGLAQTDFMYVSKCGPDGIFVKGEIQPFVPSTLSPSAGVLNYGQGLFEGLKAYRKTDGSILLFRPKENAIRMIGEAERMCMPSPTADQFVDAVKQTVLANRRWVPPTGKGSLYIRPLLIASGAVLGLVPAPEYTFIICVSPVGSYFKEGLSPMNLIVEDQFHRASPGGTGGVKTIGNYASALKAQKIAKEKEYSDVLYLDAVHNKYLGEVSSCNIYVVEGKVISTPAIKGAILHGITRKSIIEVAQNKGFKVEERLVSVDELLEAGEVFCTGTAPVVSLVGNITYLGKRVECGKQGVGRCISATVQVTYRSSDR